MKSVPAGGEGARSPVIRFTQYPWFIPNGGSGPKGPPSAPPTIPPIIINPFVYHQPRPPIDPRITPLGPPLRPPQHRPGLMSVA